MFDLSCKKVKISQKQIAERIGVSQQAVSRWVRGTSKPTADKLVKVADVLGCTVDELLREEKKEEDAE